MKNLLILSMFVASGQTIAIQAAPNVSEMLQCKVISDNSQRLACFDKFASQFVDTSKVEKNLKLAEPSNLQNTVSAPASIAPPTVPATASKPFVTLPQPNEAAVSSLAGAEPSKTKEDVFGLEHKQVITSDSDTVTALVTKVQKAPLGELIVTLSNNQVWRQTSSERMRIKSDDTVVVTRGALNSFLLNKEGSSRSIRVKRVK